MKGSSMDSTRKRVFATYLLAFFITVSVASFLQFNRNMTIPYSINIEYERSTVNLIPFSPQQTSETIPINVPVMIYNYVATLDGLMVDEFPLWINTSSWEGGATVRIADYSYLISDYGDKWRAYCDISSGYSNIISYNKDVGILIEAAKNRITYGPTGTSGYSVYIRIVKSNIGGFISRATGRDIAISTILIGGIFVNLVIIQWLTIRRRAHKKMMT
jgi:hypothetical protein